MNMIQARRHEGTEARSRRAFSLIEVLLAIIILGIGVISIAALFPAGIAQQRLSGDDFMGPVVANHAVSVIRSKVRQEDFGGFEQYFDFMEWEPVPPSGYFTRTIPGDWGWMRPSFILSPGPGNYESLQPGAIDVFSFFRTGQQLNDPSQIPNLSGVAIASENLNGWPDNMPEADRLYGIPFNTDRYDDGIPPAIIISQRERYYPMATQLTVGQDPPRPQYVWDCMFRRYQGRVYVAVFVYRVGAPGASAYQPYHVQPNPSNVEVPPVPITIDLVDPPPDWLGGGAWSIRYENDPPLQQDRPLPEVLGFPTGDFALLEENQSWQASRQWILDQNNHVHRVLSNRRPSAPADEDRIVIELTRPLTPVRLPYFGGTDEADKYDLAPDTTATYPSPNQDVYLPSDTPDEYFANPGDQPLHPDILYPNFDRGVVTRFWYVPLRMEIAGEGTGEFVLTPVYIAVKEL